MITTIDYTPAHQHSFERLNREWIEQYFKMEPIDEYVLQHPYEAILQPGGFILMALCKDQVAGTVAVKKNADQMFELTKMAVDPHYRQLGIGRLLCEQACLRTKDNGASTIILYSNTVLEPAIRLYRMLGFQEVYLEPGTYTRANIKMQKQL